MEITLLKVHGSMNTFYLVDGPENENYGQLTLQLAQLDPSIDGLLAVLPSEKDQAKMKVFNRDGSEASMCGNGLRCVARYVCERDGLDSAIIETMKASLSVKKEQPLADGIAMYAVEISPVSFELKDLPMSYEEHTEWLMKPLPFMPDEIAFSAVAVPNPHLIGIVPAAYQENDAHQKKWAEMFNGPNDYFSDGVNVSYVTKVEDGIFVKTFERGVGFTNACGTAMTASALISCLSGIVPYGEVTVYNPGGMVKCTVEEQGESYRLALSGNATYLSSHRFEWARQLEASRFLTVQHFEEQEGYQQFIDEISMKARQFV